jgi:hypothetical protein
MTQNTKHSAQPMPTATTKHPAHEPDLFNPRMSWEELCEQWAKAQHNM